ncbi:MAG: [FeFe] hydrogenase H-cluster radical SAM maturase HydG [Candidatus Firestonebacteria bacterium]
MIENTNQIVDEAKVNAILEKTKNPSNEIVLSILKKARGRKGLSPEETGYLVNANEPEQLKEMFRVASLIKNEIYGERLVFFAPLYASDYCVNDCLYCNFHTSNKDTKRTKLTLEEVKRQTEILINMGHKRVLLEFGEDPKQNDIDYVCDVVNAVYSVKTPKGNIRRINLNIAATTTENYRKIKNTNIGTYQLFQETYHRETYKKLHPKGPKSDYDRQITAQDRALEAGIDDRGIGVLFGLYDWKFEIVSLISHAEYLERKGGVGPHTISVPRLCEAPTVTYTPEYPVSDADFLKLIAIIRLAVPYTGMIISTRETAEIRRTAFKIGISQTSAASVTTTGGYGKKTASAQFETHDKRSVEEVITDAVANNILPSFCTACYRMGRTGENFMGIAKPGEIHDFCRPNGILTFAEYLEDFAPAELKQKGYALIGTYLEQIDDIKLKQKTKEHLELVKKGKRDLYF